MVKVKINAKLNSPRRTTHGKHGFLFMGVFEIELSLQQIANLMNGYHIEIHPGSNIKLGVSDKVQVEGDKLIIEMHGDMKQDSPEIRSNLVYLGWVAC